MFNSSTWSVEWERKKEGRERDVSQRFQGVNINRDSVAIEAVSSHRLEVRNDAECKGYGTRTSGGKVHEIL